MFCSLAKSVELTVINYSSSLCIHIKIKLNDIKACM